MMPTPAVRRSRRDGVVLYLVSVIAVLVGLFVSILQYQQTGTIGQLREKREKVQAQYLAKGAQQHFLLKLRVLSDRMYEAAAYAVGKNPVFPFEKSVTNTDATGVTLENDSVNGPLFFTGGSATQIAKFPSVDKPGAFVLLVDRSTESTNPGAASGLYSGPSFAPNAVPGGTNKEVMSYLVEHFLLDITSEYPQGQAVVRIKSDAAFGDKASIGTETAADVNWRDPFTGSYFVEKFVILGQGGTAGKRSGVKFEADAIEVYTEAQVRRDNQISPVTQQGGQSRVLDAVQLRSSSFEGKAGSGWPDLDVELPTQTQTQFLSNRRTEIVTSIHFVTRK